MAQSIQDMTGSFLSSSTLLASKKSKPPLCMTSAKRTHVCQTKINTTLGHEKLYLTAKS